LADVFISYAREDQAYARALDSLLGAQDWTVWSDRQISPGSSYAQVIQKELEVARCVLVLWSSASVASDWVQAEAAEGVERRILIPVLLEKVRPPLEFRRLQTLSLIGWKPGEGRPDLDELIVAVAELLGTSARTTRKMSPPPKPERSDASRRRWRRLEIAQASVAGLAVVAAIVTSLLLASSTVKPPPNEMRKAKVTPLGGTPLHILLGGAIALVPTNGPQGANDMTVLLVNLRQKRPGSDDKCFLPVLPNLQLLTSDSECTSADCTLDGKVCNCSPFRQEISILSKAKPARMLLSRRPTHPLPSGPLEARDFSYIANLSRPPLGVVLDKTFLASVPPNSLVARMKFAFESATACNLSSSSGPKGDIVYPLGFWPLHSPPKEDVGQALAQSAAFRLTIPKESDVILTIKAFDNAVVHFLKLKPGVGGDYWVQLTYEIPNWDAKYDPCAGDVDRNFAFFYDLAQSPPPWKDRPIPQPQSTQSKGLKDLMVPECAQAFSAHRGRLSAMASFNP
jgi:hypothetical protein